MSATASAVSSFAKALVLGEIHEDMVFPDTRCSRTEGGGRLSAGALGARGRRRAPP